MPKKPSDLLKIDCNDAPRQAALRWLGFLYPVWGITSILITFGWLSTGTPDAGLRIGGPINLALFLVCWPVTVSLLRKHLTIGRGSIWFPGFPKRHKLADLLFVDAKDENLYFYFRPASIKRPSSIKIEKLACQRISRANRHDLIKGLEDASVKIDDNARTAILRGGELCELADNTRLNLKYDSHPKLRAFRQVCLSYERIFWTLWLAALLPFTLFLLPIAGTLPSMLVGRFAVLDTKYISPPAWINDWGTLWNPFMNFLSTSIGTASSDYYNFLSRYQDKAALLAIASVFFGICAVKSMCKPNRLQINAESLQKSLSLGFLRLKSDSIDWGEISSIELKQNQDAKSKKLHDRIIVFNRKHDKSKRPLEISLAGLDNELSRQSFLKAIEKWGANSRIDAAIFDSLKIEKQNSYTELWLQSLNSPPKRERLKPLAPGDLLQNGSYKIVSLLASGGQGIAYVAEPTAQLKHKGEKTYVIKEFMLPIYVDRQARAQAIERFENESVLLASLDNEAIVRLQDHFIEDHRAYLVLEHIDGTSLRNLVSKTQALQHETLSSWAKQMAEVLAYLHEQSPPLVHRDFTPDNLILNQEGKLKLIDFNVAHQSDSKKTSATIVGKHAYMPPEQFAGRPCPQSDIYAFGASLYFLLSGNEPEPFTQLSLPANHEHARWNHLLSSCTALNLSERAHSAKEVTALIEEIDASHTFSINTNSAKKIDTSVGTEELAEVRSS